MRVVQINSANFGSTGKIMIGIAELARENGIDCTTVCPEGRSMRKKELPDHIFMGSRLWRNVHLQLAKYTGYNGCFSRRDTRRFLKQLDVLEPDILHFHNLHNCYINLPMLFSYVKRRKIKVIWTLHDCWSFTGQCPHFVMAGCSKWKTGCHDCPQYREYPASNVDMTEKMWKLKKEWFRGVEDLTVITPSQWLADLVSGSFLSEYPVSVINNGIDTGIFRPQKSSFRQEHGIKDDQFMLLGVASVWEKRKGIDVFLQLAEKLDERFKIVLVGTNEEVDRMLPESIISVHRTNNAEELAEIYSAADLFVNPTREDTYPTVNLESVACGTPVLTFRTGGSPESLEECTGSVVECDDVEGMIREIIDICTENRFSEEICAEKGKAFDQKGRFREYLELYGVKK